MSRAVREAFCARGARAIPCEWDIPAVGLHPVHSFAFNLENTPISLPCAFNSAKADSSEINPA